MGKQKNERTGHLTAMAGEFFVMACLYRLGYQPALTLGNAKTIDILAKTPSGRKIEISVKAIRGGGKWGVGIEDLSKRDDLFFVLLKFDEFDKVAEPPRVWVLPAAVAAKLRESWFESKAIYMYADRLRRLRPYEGAWHLLDG